MIHHYQIMYTQDCTVLSKFEERVSAEIVADVFLWISYFNNKSLHYYSQLIIEIFTKIAATNSRLR